VLQAKLNIEWGAGSGWRLGKEETKVNGILCPYINDVNVMSGNENTPKALALAAAFNSTDVWDYIQNNSKMKDYVFQGFDRPA
jgi:ABC-type metal ion transport system substrate-binding protein